MSGNLTIKKLLVANRGEIAIRVFRAATELNISTVAVYTYEDRYSLHRYKADQSYQIGDESEPLKPYLDIEEIIKVAKEHQVDAIHPGYGFLSENVEFVRRCNEENIIFVGPRIEAMLQLGDKVAAKVVAEARKMNRNKNREDFFMTGFLNIVFNLYRRSTATTMNIIFQR